MLDIKTIRNVAFVSQSSTGKSSLVAQLLSNAKVISKIPKKEEAHFTSDYTPEERERKFTHMAKVFSFPYKKFYFNLIDTPGYPDFIGEVIAGLSVVEGVVLVIDAGGSIEVQTERIWEMAQERNLPHMVFINKMDREDANFSKTLEELKEKLSKKFIPLQLPVREGKSFERVTDLLKEGGDSEGEIQKWKEALEENAAEMDDALIEKYLEEGALTPEEMRKGLQIGISRAKISPVLCGSAYTGVGTDSLLQFLIDFFPHPAERIVLDKEGKEVDIQKRSEPLAQIFKVIAEPHLGEMALFRVFSGRIASGSSLYNSSRGTEEKFGQIQLLQGQVKKEIQEVGMGQIAGIAKLKSTRTSDTICSRGAPVVLREIEIPSPITSVAVVPRERKDEEKVSFALDKLCREDPTLQVSSNKEFGELVLSGMGELHLDTVGRKLASRFGVNVDFKEPKVPYRETIKGTAKMQGKYKRQTGGHGQYGDVWLEIEPLGRGEGFEFVDKIVGGRIPSRFIPAVEKGIKDTMRGGVTTNYPVTDIKVTLYDGSFHPVDSSDIAFQIAGSMAFKEAVKHAQPVLLEPVMEAEITVPEEYVGDVAGDLNARRGKILNIETKHSSRMIKAQVPLSEMQKYASGLKSLTQGRGTYRMKFSHYEEIPPHIAKKVLEESKKSGE